MNGLTADLLEVQQHPEPHASITAHIQRRGTFSGPPLAWRSLWADSIDDVLVSGSYPGNDTLDVQAAAVVLDYAAAIVRVLRSDTAGGVWVQKVTDYTTAASWAAAPTQIATLAVPYASDTDASPGIAYFDGRIVAVYADGANLMQVASNDDGDSWGSPSVIYASSYARMTNIQIGGDSGDNDWLLAFTGVSGGGAVSLHVFTTTDGGANWTDGGNPATSVEWQPGAIFYDSPGAYSLYVWGDNLNWSTLAKWSVTVAAGVVSWGDLDVIDRAGATGGLEYDALRGGLIDDVRLLVLEERTGDQGIVATSALAGSGVGWMEEPVYLSGRGLDLSVAIEERLALVEAGDYVLLIGAAVVFLSSALVPDGDYDPAVIQTWPVMEYRYRRDVTGGGVCSLTLAYEVAVDAAPEELEHVVLVGDMIWLERTLSVPASGKSGTVYAALRALRVDRYRDRVEVLAYDGTGMLGHMRARRAKVFRVQDYSWVSDVVDIATVWAGVITSSIGAGSIGIGGSLTWRANESALGFLYRLLRVVRLAIRSDLMTTKGYLSVDVLSSEWTSVDYDYTLAAVGVATCDSGEHCVTDWMFRVDARDVRLVIGESLQTLGDPSSGALVRHDAADVGLPGGVRLTPVYYINRADSRVRWLVYAESARFALQIQAGWIEASPNIALEVLDVVRINSDRLYRVSGIDERYERGRLRQRITLSQIEEDAGHGYE